jgi:hypothetical protein
MVPILSVVIPTIMNCPPCQFCSPVFLPFLNTIPKNIMQCWMPFAKAKAWSMAREILTGHQGSRTTAIGWVVWRYPISRTGCMVFGLLMKPQGTCFLERACFETSIFNVRASSSAQKLPPSWVGEEFTLRKFPLPTFPDRLHKGRKSASKTASLPSGPLFAIGSPSKRRTIVSQTSARLFRL